MKIDQKKLARQKEGIEKWLNSSHFGSSKDRVGGWNWFTGVGKTFGAYLLCNHLLKYEDDMTTFTILVPSEITYEQWVNEMLVHIPKKYHSQFNIYTVQTYTERDLRLISDLLIVDEVHEFLTEERFKVITGEKHTHKWILALTSTWEDIHKRHLKLDKICPRIDIIDETEAVEKRYVSKFIEYNIGIDMDLETQHEYDVVTKEIANGMKKFGRRGFDLANFCLKGGVNPKNEKYYSNWQWANVAAKINGWHTGLDLSDPNAKEIHEKFNPKAMMGHAQKFFSDIRERLNIIYNAPEKKEIVIKLLQKFPDLKTICFSQSTAFADKLSLEINEIFSPSESVVYHSKVSDAKFIDPATGKYYTYTSGAKKGQVKLFGVTSAKKLAIEAIKEGHSRVITTASALDRGFDVKDIRLAIITSGTQNPTQQKQRKGRAVRLEEIYSDDTIVLLINVYIRNSRDEESLRKRQRNSGNVIFWVDSVDEINYRPKKMNVNFNTI